MLGFINIRRGDCSLDKECVAIAFPATLTEVLMEQLKAAGGKAPSMNLVEPRGGKIAELAWYMIMFRSNMIFQTIVLDQQLTNKMFGHPNDRVEVEYVDFALNQRVVAFFGSWWERIYKISRTDSSLLMLYMYILYIGFLLSRFFGFRMVRSLSERSCKRQGAWQHHGTRWFMTVYGCQ